MHAMHVLFYFPMCLLYKYRSRKNHFWQWSRKKRKKLQEQKTILHVFLENTEAAGYLRFAGKQSELSTVYFCGACIR